MRRIAVLLSAVLALFACPAGAQADPYSPGMPTRTDIEVTAGGPGQRVVVDVAVRANGAQEPSGTVEVTISRGKAPGRSAGSAGPVWSTTQRYDGSPLRIVGPRLGAGDYLAHAKFTPDGNFYRGSDASTRFRVAAGGDVGGVSADGSGGSAGAGGSGGLDASDLLPNTGGPHLVLLLLGLGMVALGGGAVARSRQLA